METSPGPSLQERGFRIWDSSRTVFTNQPLGLVCPFLQPEAACACE